MSFCACSVFHDCTEIFCQSSTVKSFVTPPPWLDGHTSTPFSKYGCRMSHAPLKKYLALLSSGEPVNSSMLKGPFSPSLRPSWSTRYSASSLPTCSSWNVA